MAALDRLAHWSTTGIGSLPHPDAQAAAAHAVAAYDVPFCPQVPRLDGDMIAQWLGSDPAGCGWSPDRDATRPRAWEAFGDALSWRSPVADVVKLQVTGPLTLAVALAREAGERPDRRHVRSLAAELATWLAANTAAQVAALRDRGLTAMLLADEPVLAMHAGAVDETLWDPLRTLGAEFGLHLCCAVPWDLVDRVRPAVLSLDLAAAPLTRRAVLGLRTQLSGGRRVAWGVIAPHRAEAAADGLRRLRPALAAVGLDERSVAARSLLTPSCGSGRMSVARERELAAELAALARALRREAPVAV